MKEQMKKFVRTPVFWVGLIPSLYAVWGMIGEGVALMRQLDTFTPALVGWALQWHMINGLPYKKRGSKKASTKTAGEFATIIRQHS